MKICNSCMQMTGVTSEKCPVCKMSDFTSLDSSTAVRERQVKKLKKAQGIYKRPRRNIRRVRYRNSYRSSTGLFRSILSFVIGSAILSIALNSTVWSHPDNPLDVRTWPSYFDDLTSELNLNLGNRGLPLSGWGETSVDDFELSLESAHFTVNKGIDYFESSEVQDLATLVLRFNVKNNSNGLVYPSIHSGALFDFEAWEYGAIDGYQIGDDYMPCPQEIDISIGWSYWVTPGETYQFTKCYRVKELSSFRFISNGHEVNIPQEEISLEKPPSAVVDSPSAELPKAGATQRLGNLEVKLNSASRGREPFEYVQFDVTITNAGNSPLSLPILNGLTSDGRRFDISRGAEAPGDRGEMTQYFSQLAPGMSHRYISSIKLSSDQALELRFLTLWYESEPSQPTAWIGFYMPAAK